jgi:hypothetical protein
MSTPPKPLAAKGIQTETAAGERKKARQRSWGTPCARIWRAVGVLEYAREAYPGDFDPVVTLALFGAIVRRDLADNIR